MSSKRTQFTIISILFFIAGAIQLVTYYFDEGSIVQATAGWLLSISGILYFLLARKNRKSE